MPRLLLAILTLCLTLLPACRALPTPAAPALAQTTLGPAHIEERAGWTIAHLRGGPDDIGYQHGYLLAERIDDAIRALKMELEHDQEFGEDWAFLCDASEKVCWPRTPPDIRAEIQGIARGLQTRGFLYTWRDILALNAHIEVGYYWLPMHHERVSGIPQPSRAPLACSAFVATGSATTDGLPVMGQNFWWGYLTGQRWNLILDISPTTGHRVAFDCLPGMVHSASDFAVNSAGLMVCETTIGDFKGFDESGIPEFVRMRRAVQHATTIHDFAQIMREGNNGGYANAWLVADATGEIGKLELGLKAVAWTTTRDGYYFGANFPEDPEVIALDCPGFVDGNEPRRTRWKQVLEAHAGRIDADVAKGFLGDTVNPDTGAVGARGGTLCGRSDLDPARGYRAGGAVSNRIATSALLRDNAFLAKWGFADGSTFDAAAYLNTRGRENAWMRGTLRDIPSEEWTIVRMNNPSQPLAPGNPKP